LSKIIHVRFKETEKEDAVTKKILLREEREEERNEESKEGVEGGAVPVLIGIEVAPRYN
jgi:hypothetical protein